MGMKFKLTGKFVMGVLDRVYYGVAELFRRRYNDFRTHRQRYVLFLFLVSMFSLTFPYLINPQKLPEVQISHQSFFSKYCEVSYIILSCTLA